MPKYFSIWGLLSGSTVHLKTDSQPLLLDLQFILKIPLSHVCRTASALNNKRNKAWCYCSEMTFS